MSQIDAFPDSAANAQAFPNFDLVGRIALVTGAARGLGRAIALALANAGADVVLGLRDIESGSGLVKEIEDLGRRALAVQLDVTRMDQIRSAVESAVEHFGRIDILVNNAGLGPQNDAVNVTEDDFELTLAVNLKGTFFVSQCVGKVMIAQNYGRIINLGSQAGFVALPGESVYCMTKAAISHLTKCLAVEWGRHNIRVNCIAPGLIKTDFARALWQDEALMAHRLALTPLGRIGEAEDIAGAALLLAAPAGRFITGQTIVVDGGVTSAS